MKDLEKRIAKLYKKRAKAHADLLEVDSELDKLTVKAKKNAEEAQKRIDNEIKKKYFVE